uniref:Uncharacterized protein n=1 Tax=Pan troglodytes TaxID=9598 RepID=A0A2I3RDH3_PANTR
MLLNLQCSDGPEQRSMLSKMSIVQRVRSPGLYRAQQSRAIATSGSCQELLCPATGLASLLWLPQELKPLSRMPFGSGQVSPAELTAGHAVHQPELMCFIIYSHRASRPAGSFPAREEASSTEAHSPRQLTARGIWGRLLLRDTWE